MKRKLLLALCFFLIIFFVGGGFYFKNDKTMQLPLPDEAEWTKEWNRQMKESFALREKLKDDISPEKKQEVEIKERLLSAITSAQSKQITFYGKVLDQYGQPVSKAQVIYSASSPMAEASGRSETYTDSQGLYISGKTRTPMPYF